LPAAALTEGEMNFAFEGGDEVTALQLVQTQQSQGYAVQLVAEAAWLGRWPWLPRGPSEPERERG